MSAKLMLGVAREDITPEIGGNLFGYRPDLYSESLNDNLTATAFAFSCGKKRALMITTCVCLIDDKVISDLKGLLSEKFGVEPHHIMISATHTHTGPSMADMDGWGGVDYPYYYGIFKPAVISAAEKAFGNTQPVKMGSAVGKSEIGINRRCINEDNSIGLGQCEWAPFNPYMTVLSFKNEKDEIVGSIIHYGAHGTCAGIATAISRDWSGVMTDALDAVTGGITAFFNGPEGDVGPRLLNGWTVGDMSDVKELGTRAAADAVRIFSGIKEYKDVTLSVKSEVLKLKLSPRISYDAALAGCEKYSDDTINIDKKIARYYRDVKASYEDGYEEKDFRELIQTAIRIGDTAFVSFPYELFSEIGMRINKSVKDLNVLSLSNTNGHAGYFPTQDQLCRGGYEILSFLYNNVQCYGENADFNLIQETLNNISTLERE